jgi:hypothetical protein
VILSELDDDWTFDSILSFGSVITGVDLAKGAFGELALDLVSSIQNCTSEFVDDWHLSMLLAYFLECDLLLEVIFHLCFTYFVFIY